MTECEKLLKEFINAWEAISWDASNAPYVRTGQIQSVTDRAKNYLRTSNG